ncbi:nuclear transport factor 2 family protein [Parabacteroides sp. Marseille-P3160]|uniref:YybH family protein n=1 Tax=Parabacteroides sp. Marseille-P3160 TaxID=1917887 RepID=UPI0009B953A2|nr:nuclear transport factor 2 family protein [Parabacteroides sp. Marseille-P3160]
MMRKTFFFFLWMSMMSIWGYNSLLANTPLSPSLADSIDNNSGIELINKKMKTSNSNLEKDKETLIAMVKDMSTSMTGKQSTKNWAENVLWFDIAPFASKGIKPAKKMFDDAFGELASCDVEILSYDFFINGDMAIVCSVQKMKTVSKDGTVNAPIIVRQTDCFEKQNEVWKIIHEHSSIPASEGWDGTFTIK